MPSLVHEAKPATVPLDRHTARILAMQALVQLDAQGDAYAAEADAFLSASPDTPADVAAYARELTHKAWQNRADLDEKLSSASHNWDLSRMGCVDRNVMRVALVELAGRQVPPSVVINEAIEIANEYSSADSHAFVNAVLDAIMKSSEQQGEP